MGIVDSAVDDGYGYILRACAEVPSRGCSNVCAAQACVLAGVEQIPLLRKKTIVWSAQRVNDIIGFRVLHVGTRPVIMK